MENAKILPERGQTCACIRTANGRTWSFVPVLYFLTELRFKLWGAMEKQANLRLAAEMSETYCRNAVIGFLRWHGRPVACNPSLVTGLPCARNFSSENEGIKCTVNLTRVVEF